MMNFLSKMMMFAAKLAALQRICGVPAAGSRTGNDRAAR